MLTRPKIFRRSDERLHDIITLAARETPRSRFKRWLAEKTREPHFCQYHTRTALIFDPNSSSIQNAVKKIDAWQEEIIPGVFKFFAFLHCAACRAAYANCPPEFHETTFDTFDVSTGERSGAVARSRNFVAQVNRSGCGFMLLVGGPGCGKTRLACNIIRELRDPEADAFYVRHAQLTLELRANYGRKEVVISRRLSRDDKEEIDDKPPTPLEFVQRVRFLVLDELGCKPLAVDETVLIDELIKHRYEERKPTILISNLPLASLKHFLGDALTDRIVEATGNRKYLLQFAGASYRRTTGTKYLDGLPGNLPMDKSGAQE